MLAILLSIAAAGAGSAAPAQPASPPVLRRTPPALDPAKAELARSIAARLVPVGINRALLSDPFNVTILSLVHSYLMMSVEQFAASVGAKLPEEGITGPPAVRLGILHVIDPASAQRAKIADAVIRDIAIRAATAEEPRLREAVALAYANRLSVDELRAVDVFLAPPAGAAFARATAVLDDDLDVRLARSRMERAIMASGPQVAARVNEEAASLPSIKTPADLSPAERRKIADLLQISESQLDAQSSE